MGRRPADHRHAEPGDRDGAGPVLRRFSAFRPRTCCCAARSSAAASARRRSWPARRSCAFWRRGCLGGRSSWCCRATRCSGRSDTAARRSSSLRLGTRCRGAAHRARASRGGDDQQLRRFHRARGQRFAQPLCQPGDLDPAWRGAGRHRNARADAGARRGHRLGGARMRDGRGRAGLRARSAGVSPAQLRRDRPGDRASHFRPRRCASAMPQGAERFGWAGRPLGAAADARRRRSSRRLGHGHGALPRADVPGRGARHAARATAPRWSRPPAPTWARAPGPRWPRSPPTGWASTSTGSSFAPARPSFPMAASPAVPGHTATAGSALYNAGADVIAKLAELAANDEDSPLFGAGNAGVEARGGRLYHRGDETRSESYADILARGQVAPRRKRPGARDPANARGARDVLARRGLRRGQGRPRSRPGPVTQARRRLRGRADHQSAGWRAASFTAG